MGRLSIAPLAVLAGLLGGCREKQATLETPPHPMPAVLGPGSPTDLAPPPVVAPAVRPRRRVDIDQLDATIRKVTGGIGWTEMRSGKEVNLWSDLSLTLGKPDYVGVITEDLSPTPLFQKFLDDAARSVCAKLMAAELERKEGERVFLVYAGREDTVKSAPEKIERNLQELLLRFHGRSVSTDSPALEPWRWLFTSTAHVTGDPMKAWQTVCVSLIVHPEFYSY